MGGVYIAQRHKQKNGRGIQMSRKEKKQYPVFLETIRTDSNACESHRKENGI